ncbi:MAG: hypothetical protein CMP10_05560 [Zetaproteobacteria bacterium]|nr:hypothetical protein [Pseudobdellovibrionaceae bacterium]|tara:strand:+ start:950 stop:1912 length:963 start_codon:yes stop_codon:yes gene_type:complete
MNEVILDGFVFQMISWIASHLITIMTVIMVLAVIMRLLIYFTVMREAWFVNEFEKRVYQALSRLSLRENLSFFSMTKAILQKTYYEIFELRAKYGRRRPDQLMSGSDRIFLIREGVGRIIMDFMRQAKYLRKDQSRPRFLELSKTIFMNNPVFGKVIGIFPIDFYSNLIGILPGIFVVMGIFGTFIGIVQGLPALSGMDVTNADQSKLVMDKFLESVAFAMNSSIVGILYSIIMSFINAILNPDSVYYALINKFTASLELLWNKAETNEIDDLDIEFVEAGDSIDRDILTENPNPSEMFDNDNRVLTGLPVDLKDDDVAS